jgi:hypothetical protein
MSIRLPLAAGGFSIANGKHDAPVRPLYDLSRISLIFAASRTWVTGF